jgi:hypothetical protein
MTPQEVVYDIHERLGQVCFEASMLHNLEPAAVTVISFELLAETLRNKAPMEFDEYVEVLMAEIAKGREASGPLIHEYRGALTDVVILNTSD